MADTAAVWRASRALYFAVLNELVNGAEAEHGPWPMEDFDAKLVRAANWVGLRLGSGLGLSNGQYRVRAGVTVR